MSPRESGLRSLLVVAAMLLCQTLVAAERPVLLVFGDSLSAGFGIDQSQTWTILLQQKLDHSPYRFTVQNASISGETSAGGLQRFPRTLRLHRPAIVIIELGGNDGLRGLPLDRMRENLATMIRLAKEAGARVLLTGMHLPPNFGPVYTRAFHDSYQQLARNHGIALLPFLLDGIATDRDLMQTDGIHPRAEAQARIVENLWPVLEPLLKATR